MTTVWLFEPRSHGLCEGFPPGGEVTWEVMEVSWLSHACGCERRAHCEFNRHYCQSAYAPFNLKASPPCAVGCFLEGSWAAGAKPRPILTVKGFYLM